MRVDTVGFVDDMSKADLLEMEVGEVANHVQH